MWQKHLAFNVQTWVHNNVLYQESSDEFYGRVFKVQIWLWRLAKSCCGLWIIEKALEELPSIVLSYFRGRKKLGTKTTEITIVRWILTMKVNILKAYTQTRANKRKMWDKKRKTRVNKLKWSGTPKCSHVKSRKFKWVKQNQVQISETK